MEEDRGRGEGEVGESVDSVILVTSVLDTVLTPRELSDSVLGLTVAGLPAPSTVVSMVVCSTLVGRSVTAKPLSSVTGENPVVLTTPGGGGVSGVTVLENTVLSLVVNSPVGSDVGVTLQYMDTKHQLNI